MVGKYEQLLGPGSKLDYELKFSSDLESKLSDIMMSLDDIRGKIRLLDNAKETVNDDDLGDELNIKLTILADLLIQKKAQIKDTILQIKKEMTLDTEKVELFAIIKHQCSNYIQEMVKVNKFLYRGSRYNAVAYKGRPRDDRKPKDSRRLNHDLINIIFSYAGSSANRGNSIFCSGNFNQANGYGHYVHYIFPTNDASFAWTRHSDAMDDISQVLQKKYDHRKVNIDHYSKPEIRQEIARIWDLIQKDSKWLAIDSNNNAKNAIKQLINVYLSASSPDELKDAADVIYQRDLLNSLVFYSDVKIPEILKTRRDVGSMRTPDEIIQELDIKMTDFDEALKSGNEIIVSGEYYALRRDKWQHFLMTYMGFGDGDNE